MSHNVHGLAETLRSAGSDHTMTTLDKTVQRLVSQARLFIALWPAADLARSLSALAGDCADAPGSRLVASNSLHLTLVFLGNVNRGRISELVQALRVPFQTLELIFSGRELWRHGLVVTRPDAVPQALIELHAALCDALHRMDFRIEGREFRPHMTLARRHFRALPELTGPAIRWSVDGYVLVESKAAAGSEYQLIQRYGKSA